VAGNAAIYCNPFDTKEIADGIQKLITDENLRSTLSIAGQSRGELFSWDVSARKVWEIIEENHTK
jgi:glycosyltransferase involved in cell wall biosynthesis